MSATLEQFIAALADTGLMSKAEVQAFTNSLPPPRQPADAQLLARELFQAGKLTRYQAAAIYQGKAAGLVFGEYLVLDKLGAGGMGQVFKAQHRRMKRIVALKVLPPQATKSPNAVRRFYREVEMAGKLVHPNIVTAYDANEAGGLHYMAMEFVDGQDLSAMVRQHGPLPVDTAVSYILQASRALEFAHGLAIIHRDIKPGNLLVDRDGVLKVLDMGLARVTDAATAADKAAAEGLTQQGDVMGTVEYMAPEQALDPRQATFRSDIYSLGCTLYRLLTGEMMYAAKTPIQQILAHRGEPIPLLREKRPEVSEAIETVFRKMVAKQPAERFASTADLVKELTALGAGAAKTKATVRATATGGPQDAEFTNFLQNLTVAGPATVFKAQAANQATRDGQSERSTSGSKGGKIAAPVADRRKWLVGGGAVAVALAIVMSIVVLLNGGNEQVRDVADATAADNGTATIEPEHVTELTAKPDETAANPPMTTPPQLVPPPPLPVLAPRSSSPPPPLKETVDLLKLIDLRRDTINGAWKREGTSVVALPVPMTRIMIPYSPPEEYSLTAVVERVEGVDSLGLGLVVGGSQCRVIIDATKSTFSGLDMVDGLRFDKNQTTLLGHFLPAGEPITVVCHIRRTGLQVLRNGQQFFAWSGDPKRLSNSPSAAVPDPTRLFVTSHNTTMAIRKLELSPLSTAARFPPVSPPPSSTIGPPISSPPVAPLTARLDLLKMIDPKRHGIVGSWKLESGGLVVPRADGARLQLPFQPPEEYVLSLTVERVSGRDALAIGIIVGGAQAVVGFDNFYGTYSGLEHIDGQRLNVNETRVAGQVFAEAEPRVVVCTVRRNGVRVAVDGKPFMEWTGDPKRLSLQNQWRVPDPRRLFVGAWNSGFRISKFEIAPIGQAAEIEAAARPLAEAASAPESKLPIPAEEALEKAREQFQSLIGDDLTKPRKPEEAGFAATVLLKHAAEREVEPPVLYLLLSEAQRLAVQGGRLEPAFEAIAELAQRFDVNSQELEKSCLADVMRLAKTPQARQVIVEDALALVDRMLKKGRYDIASDLHDAALATVQKITNPTLLKEVRSRTTEVKDFRKQWDAAQAATEKLKSAPDDAAAHLALGRFHCFVLADWDAGLPHLVKGSDSALRAAAELDVRSPGDSGDRLNLADAWWDLAEKSPMPAKLMLMERAALWYERVPKAEQGTSQVRITPRLDKLAEVRRTAGPALTKRHPLDALHWQGHWYKAFPERLTWTDARRRCEELGGHLACIESAAENEFLAQQVEALIPPNDPMMFAMWIGLTDEAVEGQFRWVNDSPLRYTNWKPGEPNNSAGGEDFVAIARFNTDRTRLRWNDFGSNYSAGFLCEWER